MRKQMILTLIIFALIFSTVSNITVQIVPVQAVAKKTIYVDTSAIDALPETVLSAAQKTQLKNKIIEKIKENLESAAGAGNVEVTNDPTKKAGASRKVDIKNEFGGGAWGGWTQGSDTGKVYLKEFLEDPNVAGDFKSGDPPSWDVDKLANGIAHTASHELGHTFSVGHNKNTGDDINKMTTNEGAPAGSPRYGANEKANRDWGYDEHTKKVIKENWEKEACASEKDYELKALYSYYWDEPLFPRDYKLEEFGGLDALFGFSGLLASDFYLGFLGFDSDNGLYDGSAEFDFIYKSSMEGLGADAEMLTFFKGSHDYTQFLLKGAPNTTWADDWFLLPEGNLYLTNNITRPDGREVSRFVVMEWDVDGIPGVDVQVTLDANAYGAYSNPYHGFTYELPPVGTTDICFYGSRDQAFTALMDHYIDFYDYPLTYEEYAIASADPTIQLAGSSPNEIYAFAFNNNWTIPSHPGFRNPLNYIGFRQAIAHLVDKDYIAEGIMDWFAEVVDAPLPAAYAGYADESMTGGNYPYSYSPSTANAILDASGWVQGSTPNPYYDGGFPGSAPYIRTYPPGHSKTGMDLDPIIFYAPSYDSLKLAASQYFRDTLRKIGIPVDFQALSLELCHPPVMDEHDYHIYTVDMSFRQYMPYPTYLYRLFHSRFFFSNGSNYVTGMNTSNLPNYPKLDEILEQVYHARDVMSFVDAVKRATGLLIEEAISIWLVNPIGWYAYRKNVVSIVNMKGVGVVNDYTFLNARKVDDPDTVVDESLQPLKVGTVYAPINLNILYSQWDCDYAVLERVFSRLLKVNPYNPSVINPWIAQDYETTIWYDPSDDKNKTKVTFWLRKDVYWHAPVTGNQVSQFNAYDVEFSIWYINLFEDSWHWGTTREVHHAVVLNDFTIAVYFNDESIWGPYGIGLEMPLLPGEEYMEMIGLLMNPKGYYLADLDWDLTFYSLGTHYPTEMYKGIGGCVTLKSNPTHFLNDSPLGEIDWMWYWSGTTKPRSGYYQINLYDAVTLLTAYGTRGDGIPPPNWEPGADIDAYDLCHIGLYDAVTLLSKYGTKFGTPPP